MKLAFLASAVTLPGSPSRRTDAFEHDYQVDALRPNLARHGIELVELSWDDPNADWGEFDAALIGTTWDYWDRSDQFLATLDRIEACGTPLFNPAGLVRWNARKTYLRDLAVRGLATIPTLWPDRPNTEDLAQAFRTLDSDDLIVKRQVGAGAFDQIRIRKGDALKDYPFRAMIQPFQPAIESEGEFSFVMIDGQLSHALVKKARAGDYRIQSLYGGVEAAFDPAPADLAAAQNVMDALDQPPLYARVDMVRGAQGDLLLMELELIEPYLYPLQGPTLGPMMADAIKARLSS